MKLKKIAIVLAAIIGVFINVAPIFAVSNAALKFDLPSYSAEVGSTFDAAVIVSPGSSTISSTDAIVTYDSTALQVQSITPGTYFPSVTNSQTPGKVSIYGTVNDVASSKTGDGTIATITFVVLKNASTAVQYYCDANSGTSSKVIKYEPSNIDGTNVLVCSSNQTATVTGGIGGSSTPTATPTLAPSILATPTPLTKLPDTGTVSNLTSITVLGVLLVLVGGIVKILL